MFLCVVPQIESHLSSASYDSIEIIAQLNQWHLLLLSKTLNYSVAIGKYINIAALIFDFN